MLVLPSGFSGDSGMTDEPYLETDVWREGFGDSSATVLSSA